MKHYQRKKPIWIDYFFYSLGPLLFGTVYIFLLLNKGFKEMSIGIRIFGAIIFALPAFYSVKQFCEFLSELKFRRTIELDDDGITYVYKDLSIIMKWIDVACVRVVTSRYIHASDKIVFFAKGVDRSVWTPRITKNLIWANMTDEMLEDIKQHWGLIENEGAYNKYKKLMTKLKLRK